MRCNHWLREVANADSIESTAQRQISVIDDERAFDGDLGLLAAFGEDPARHGAVPWRAGSDAVMGMQVFWDRRSRMVRQIGRGGDRKHPELFHEAQDRH